MCYVQLVIMMVKLHATIQNVSGILGSLVSTSTVLTVVSSRPAIVALFDDPSYVI